LVQVVIGVRNDAVKLITEDYVALLDRLRAPTSAGFQIFTAPHGKEKRHVRKLLEAKT
jgi:hypothetical protein